MRLQQKGFQLAAKGSIERFCMVLLFHSFSLCSTSPRTSSIVIIVVTILVIRIAIVIILVVIIVCRLSLAALVGFCLVRKLGAALDACYALLVVGREGGLHTTYSLIP